MGASLKLRLLDARQRDYLLAWLLFLAALVVRFRYLPWIEHNIDHAYYIGQALRTLDEGYLPIIGQATSLQFPNSAFLGYLYVPLLALTRHVLSAYVFVIALNSLGVVFIFRAARLLGLSAFAAAAGGVLYAFNPWLIEYTRSTWSYSIMPFLLTCLFYSVLLMLTTTGGRQTTAVWVAAVSTTMITLVTLTGYLILPTLAIIALVFRARLPWRKILIVLPIFVVPTAVFAGALLVNWQDTSARASTFLGASQSAYLRSEPLLHTLRLVSGAEYELQRGTRVGQDSLTLRNSAGAVFNLAIAILVVVGLLNQSGKTNKKLNAIWIATPIVIFLYNSALVHPFYLLLTVPSATILTAAGMHHILKRNRHSTKAIAAALAMWSLLSLTNSSLYYQETQQHPGEHQLTALPVHEGIQLGNILRELPEEALIQTDVEPWILHSFTGHTFPTTQTADNKQRVAAPTNGLFIITMQERPQDPLLNEEIYWNRTLADNSTISILKISNTIPENTTYVSNNSKADITLEAYSISYTETETYFTVYWRVQRTPPDLAPLYSPTIHVYYEGNRLAVADGRPIATYLWTPETLIAQRVKLQLTQGKNYTLRIGLYDGALGKHAFISQQEADGLITIEVKTDEQN